MCTQYAHAWMEVLNIEKMEISIHFQCWCILGICNQIYTIHWDYMEHCLDIMSLYPSPQHDNELCQLSSVDGYCVIHLMHLFFCNGNTRCPTALWKWEQWRHSLSDLWPYGIISIELLQSFMNMNTRCAIT